MFLLALIVAAPLHLHFDASELPNRRFLHVAPDGERLACTQAVYAKFWNETYNVTREDGLRFDEFRKIFEALENEAGKSQPTPFPCTKLSRITSPSLRAPCPSCARPSILGAQPISFSNGRTGSAGVCHGLPALNFRIARDPGSIRPEHISIGDLLPDNEMSMPKPPQLEMGVVVSFSEIFNRPATIEGARENSRAI